MDKIRKEELDYIFTVVGEMMEANREYLIGLDAVIGDGDLGITMSKGFKAVAQAIGAIDGEDLGKCLMKLGMIMAETVPSTMGTLMASGLMGAGKKLKGIHELKTEELAILFEGFTESIMERGKAKPGEKTVIDSLYPAAQALRAASKNGASLDAAVGLAFRAAKDGLKATIEMKSTYGKAAIYQEKSIGKQDPGATVGKLFVEGFYLGITGGPGALV